MYIKITLFNIYAYAGLEKIRGTVEPLLYDHPQNQNWCGRIRGMVAREGFVYKQNAVRHTKCDRMRGMVVGEGGRSSGVLL